LLLAWPNIAKCQAGTDSLYSLLKQEIGKKNYYDQLKEHRITLLKQQLKTSSHNNLVTQYIICKQLSQSYHKFVFDSVYVYLQRQLQLGILMNDVLKQYEVEITLGDIQLARGMFKETFDYLRQIKVSILPDSTKQQYYKLKSLAYNNLALYNVDSNSPKYAEISRNSLNTAIALAKPGSYEEAINLANLQVVSGHPDKAFNIYYDLLNDRSITLHERAMIAFNIGGHSTEEQKIKWLMKSVIYDIQSSTNETLAAFDLGKIFVRRRQFSEAELLLNLALQQSHQYGNRKQESEVIAVLKTVEAQRIIDLANKKNNFLTFIILISVIAASGIAYAAYLVYNQSKKIKVREAIVQQKNTELDSINRKLLEDARIKEEYIGYFFNIISGHIVKLDKIKKGVTRNLKAMNYQEVFKIAQEIDITQDRADLFYTFDSIFLKLFPNFIIKFNALLKPEDQIWPKRNEILNTHLRLYALVRLGITDNQAIANILETAVNTVYTYKTRIRSKAIVSAENFERMIMEIKFSE